MNYHTQQVRLSVDDATRALIEFECEAANSLYNAVLYTIRRAYFEENQDFYLAPGGDDVPRQYRKLSQVKGVSYGKLCAKFKDEPHFKCMTSAMAQQTIKSVVEAVTSYNALLKAYFKDGSNQRPRIPGYRTSRGLAPLATPARWVKWDLETGECILPMGKAVKDDILSELQLSEVRINGGYGFKPDQVKEVRVVPKLGEFYIEYVYTTPKAIATDLDPTQALGIDHGRDNWLTCVSTLGKSFIVDGRKLKSLNQGYNKRVAQIQTGKPEKYWDAELDRITTKRNNQMRDAINKTARFIVNYCLKNRIGQVIFGWHKGMKDGSNMSRLQNQQFVQIPTGRLKERLRQLCEENGLEFVETEEAYTSKASFLDGDSLPRHGEKPSQWRASGKRVSRGLYRASNGEVVNADCNGAANIIAKVATQLGINLAKVGRGALNLPKRYDAFSDLSRLYCGVADRITIACAQATNLESLVF